MTVTLSSAFTGKLQRKTCSLISVQPYHSKWKQLPYAMSWRESRKDVRLWVINSTKRPISWQSSNQEDTKVNERQTRRRKERKCEIEDVCFFDFPFVNDGTHQAIRNVFKAANQPGRVYSKNQTLRSRLSRRKTVKSCNIRNCYINNVKLCNTKTVRLRNELSEMMNENHRRLKVRNSYTKDNSYCETWRLFSKFE